MTDLSSSAPVMPGPEPEQGAARAQPLLSRDAAGGTAFASAAPDASRKPPTDANAGRPEPDGNRRVHGRRRRPKPWSVLDLIWTLGDYGNGNWSATLKLDDSVVVVAHDGGVLGQFLLDLTKAILNGLGKDYLRRHTHLDRGRYVIPDDYLLVTGSDPDKTAGLEQEVRHTPNRYDASRGAPAA